MVGSGTVSLAVHNLNRVAKRQLLSLVPTARESLESFLRAISNVADDQITEREDNDFFRTANSGRSEPPVAFFFLSGTPYQRF